MNITCDFNICIYEKNGVCTLDEIEINGCGSCRSCIVTSWDEEELQKSKDALLKKFGDE